MGAPVRLHLVAATIFACLLFHGCKDGAAPGGSAGSGAPGSASAAKAGEKTVAVVVPAIDRNAPFPALSEGVLDALAVEVPDLAKRREAILAAERAAIKRVLDARRVSPARKPNGKGTALGPGNILGDLLDHLVPSAVAADSTAAAVTAMIVGHNFVTLLGSAGAGVAVTKDTKDTPGKTIEAIDGGKVVATATLAVENGQPVATLETTVDVPFFLVEANSKVSLVGSVCPDPDGKVGFTMKQGSNGHAGKAGSATYDQHIEARIDAQVNDDAEIVDSNIDVKQDTRSSTGGRQAYVESSLSVPMPGGKMGSEFSAASFKVARASSQVTDVERQAANETLVRGMFLAIGALQAAEDFWRKGGCIKIIAKSPGHVAPGEISRIPVDVVHQKDGGSVPAKVVVALAGGKSVDPAVIPRAPGEVTHVAPSDRKSRMTITLTATSRRGRDVAELEMSTGTAFVADGGLDDFHGTGVICDIGKPFTIEGSGNVVKFVPTSEKGGTYSYAGTMSGFGVFGEGTYTVTYQEDLPVGITATGVGSVKTPMGVHSNKGTEKYTLTPRNGC